MWFVDVFFVVVGCDAAENYMLMDIHNWWSGWIVIWGNSHELNFYIFLTGATWDNLLLDSVMGLKILKWKCACGSCFVKIIWKLLSLKRIYHELGHQAVLSVEVARELRYRSRELVEVSLVASVILSIHAKLSSHVLAIQEERYKSEFLPSRT